MGMQIWKDLSGPTVRLCINCFSALGIFYEGYNQGVMGGVFSSPDAIQVTGVGSNGVVTNATKVGGLVPIYYLGTLVGCLWAGSMSDKYGRKLVVFLGTLWAIFGAALLSAAQNDNWFLCGRLISGVGTGHLINIVPVWSSELAPTHTRGKSVCLLFLANYLGIAVAYWLGFGLSSVEGDVASIRWRFPIAFNILPAAVLALTIFFFPESPRWLIRHDRHEEALEILQKVREGSANGETTDVLAEFEEIRRVTASEVQNTTRDSLWAMPFGYKSGNLHYGRRVALAFFIQIMMEWGGITACVMYGPQIIAQAGWDAHKIGWTSSLINTFGILGTYICALLIDRIGRRNMLYIGSTGCAISMFAAGAFAKLVHDNPENNAGYGIGCTVFLVIFTLFFSSTWLMVTWIYPTEIFPTEVRTKGNSFAVAGFAVGCASTTLVNPIMFTEIKYNTFWLFGCLNFIYPFLIWAFYPETAKRSLETMDFLFASKSPFAWEEEKELERLYAMHGGKLTLHDVVDDAPVEKENVEHVEEIMSSPR